MNREHIHIVAFVSSLIIVIGCFLPWIQLGALFTNRGVDSPDGAVVLISSIIAASVAYFNQKKNQNQLTWLYIVVGIGAIIVASMDLKEAYERAEIIANGLNELSSIYGEERQVKLSGILGSGLFTVFFGAIGLLSMGLYDYHIRRSEEGLEKSNDNHPKNEPEREKELDDYGKKVAILQSLITKEKTSIFPTKDVEVITSMLSELCDSAENGHHLLRHYYEQFQENLIEELKKCSSQYRRIKTLVWPLIEHGIVEETYPHTIIDSSVFQSDTIQANVKTTKTMAEDFEEVWRKYIIPLKGETILTATGAKNQLVDVNDSELRRISSKGNESSIPKTAFGEIYQELLSSKEISRIAVNEKYKGRGSSLICAVLAQVPFISLTVKNGTVHLVISEEEI